MSPTPVSVGKRLPPLIAGLAGAGIIGLGCRFLLDPPAAVRGYGVPVSPEAVGPYLSAKGARDIASGLVVLAVLATGQRRALGWALLAAASTPVADMLIVLRNGGTRAVAFGIHGLTAAVLIADAAALIRQAGRR